MKRLIKLNEALYDYLVIVFVFIMLVSVSLQVFFRYVIGNPLGWSEEVARFALIWLAYIGTGSLILKNDHFSVDLLFKKMPKKMQLASRIVSNAAMLFFGVIMVWGGLKMVSSLHFGKSSALNIPLGFIYGIIPLGGIIIIVSLIMVIISQALGER